MKYLFIGGTWDGQRRTLNTTPERLTVMSLRDAGEFWTQNPYRTPEVEDYHLHGLRIAGVDFLVYTHGRIDAALIMQRLLDHYTAENKA